MNIKTLVSKYLKSQGTAPKKNDLGLNFSYEGWNFLLWNDADDPMFFRLILPGVFDVTDDNFATIIRAVEAGRKIYDNICKVLQFQLSTNMAEVLIIFFASILNFTILTPVHLLWINMVTDTLPGLALGMES